jgi:hypothetical protein
MQARDIEERVKRRAKAFAATYCKRYAAQAEQWAKEHAEWNDHTGDARELMTGFVINDDTAIGFGVAHRKEYGFWLETANDGKYAILKPTVAHFLPQFMEAARRHLT